MSSREKIGVGEAFTFKLVKRARCGRLCRVKRFLKRVLGVAG